ncbi:MAG TPA: hypothetical protein VKT70_01410 [Stellaceae bacterium]|nr:hypothetical protein [Stellaceae bacterium]
MQFIPPSAYPILLIGALLASCSGGAREVDYSRDRTISQDIESTHNQGPVSATPGLNLRHEPLGAIPWVLDERHQDRR